MSLTLTPYAHGTLCHGCSWTVTNLPDLADQVARVALGHSRHVAKVLAGASAAPPPSSEGMRQTAIALLTVPPGKDPWHRDGWIFQVISWIAANRAYPNAVIRTPHMIHAHKGFDGLLLEIDNSTGLVAAAVIFEDKATDDPRGTIHGDVWPDFRLLEAGDRENLLSAEVSTLLMSRPDLDADKAIEKVIWKQVRRYRVSITVGAGHASDDGRLRLFKDFDDVAGGDVQRRRGDILHLQDLRPWMQSLADASVRTLRNLAIPNV